MPAAATDLDHPMDSHGGLPFRRMEMSASFLPRDACAGMTEKN
ncbi:MAG: hypothetical protein R6V55_12445 [Desulfovermiculus sp.]